MLQIPTCCFEGRLSIPVMVVFMVMIRSGAVAGCITMLFAFSGEAVLFVTHFVDIILCWRHFERAQVASYYADKQYNRRLSCRYESVFDK